MHDLAWHRRASGRSRWPAGGFHVGTGSERDRFGTVRDPFGTEKDPVWDRFLVMIPALDRPKHRPRQGLGGGGSADALFSTCATRCSPRPPVHGNARFCTVL